MARKKPPSKAIGRPAWKPDLNTIAQVEKLAGQGMFMEQIAICLGIAPSTLYKNKAANTELAEAVQRGRAIGTELISRGLVVNATTPTKFEPGGSVRAQQYYLKNVSGWSDGKPKEPAGGGTTEVRRIIIEQVVIRGGTRGRAGDPETTD